MRKGNRWKLKLATAGVLASLATASFAGQMTVYPNPGFQGQGLTTTDAMTDLGRSLFASQASSAVVSDGAWEACTEAYFRGRCAQLAVSPDAIPVPAGPQIILYQNTPRGMRAVELTQNVDDLDSRSFSNSAYAAFVSSGTWRLCDRERGRGRCSEFAPGRYENLNGLEGHVRSAYLIATTPERVANIPNYPPGRAVLYQFPHYAGRSAVVENGRAPDLDWAHFKEPAGSLRVESGTWLVCSEIGYQGECRVLGPGNYPQLTDLMNAGVYSARQVWRPEYGYDSNNRYTIR